MRHQTVGQSSRERRYSNHSLASILVACCKCREQIVMVVDVKCSPLGFCNCYILYVCKPKVSDYRDTVYPHFITLTSLMWLQAKFFDIALDALTCMTQPNSSQIYTMFRFSLIVSFEVSFIPELYSLSYMTHSISTPDQNSTCMVNLLVALLILK